MSLWAGIRDLCFSSYNKGGGENSSRVGTRLSESADMNTNDEVQTKGSHKIMKINAKITDKLYD